MHARVPGCGRPGDRAGPAIFTVIKAGVYVLVMFWIVRPFLQRLQAVHDRQGKLSQNVIAIIFLLTLLSALHD